MSKRSNRNNHRSQTQFKPSLNNPVPPPQQSQQQLMGGRKGVDIDLNKLAAYNGSVESMFTPGMPVSPTPGINPNGYPRTFQYPVGYNTNVAVRGLSDNPFDVLRNFAQIYDGIGLCERVWLDVAAKLKLKIKPKDGVLKDGEDESKYKTEIDKYTDFFKMPDKSNRLMMKEFMAAALLGQLRYDAVVIYLNKSMGGDLLSLDLVDGATIKPVLGVRGEVVGYQQIVYNVPGDIYSPEEIWYIREKPQLDSPFGFSREEAIMLTINMALRKQNKDFAFWTASNVPQAFMEIPETEISNPEELKFYEDMFNSLYAGNPQQQQRIKFGRPGWKFNLIQEPLPLSDFDIFLLKKTVAAYGLTMDEIGFTENSNRSVGDSQEAVIYRRTIEPVANMYAAIFTRVIEECFGDDRFEAIWTGYEEAEDFSAMSAAHVSLVTAGIESPSDAAKVLGVPVRVDVGPYVLTKSGITFLEDAANPQFRQAQMDAQMAGLQMAKESPDQKPSQDAPDDQEDASSDDDDQSTGQDKKPPKTTQDANNRYDRATGLEYRRWEDMVLNRMKAGKPIRRFESELIPTSTLAMGHLALQQCKAPDDVKQFFTTVKEQVYA